MIVGAMAIIATLSEQSFKARPQGSALAAPDR
jgi:hypothetical protein